MQANMKSSFSSETVKDSEHFKIGETVVHCTYGPGVIVEIDQKIIRGDQTDCYVVKIDEMTLWVPFSRAVSGSLRLPSSPARFERLFKILSSPAETLSSDRLERRTHLSELINSGKLEAICRLVRDLATLKRTGKLNDHDKLIYERSQRLLLGEWEIVLSVSVDQAEQMLHQLLEETISPPAESQRHTEKSNPISN
jgi:CarD family transcriptional regulator